MSKKRQEGKEAMPLRLEWVEAGSLTENPSNWRRHPEEQIETLRDLLDDPEVGWAGALLFNERTKRLVDGHARLKAVKPDALVPVLVGDWSENAEKQILATLDPLAAMANGDAQVFRQLVEDMTTDSLWTRDLAQQVQAELDRAASDTDEQGSGDNSGEVIPEMERHPFEHYDYVVLIFRDEQDWSSACEKLGIQKVQVKYPKGLTKIGVGRVVDGPTAIRKLEGGN